MRDFALAVRTLFKKGRYNVLKIVSLAVGLAVGLLLLAQLFFERSFDDCYPDVERLYLLVDHYSLNGDEKESFHVSGGVPAAIRAEITGVEDALRFTYIFSGNTVLIDGNGRRVRTEAAVIAADSNYFDLLPVPLLGGRAPKDVLSRPKEVMISRSLAGKLGGVAAALGQRLSVEGSEWLEFSVGGVYEDMPRNSSFRYDVIVSSGVMGEWSLNNWIGNDRYSGVVKLREGVTPESLREPLDAMLARHVDMNELHAAGYEVRYDLYPLRDRYLINEGLRSRHAMLMLLAVVLLLTAMLNYALVSLSSIVNRSKEVAICKTYGAGQGTVYRRAFAESVVHTVVALLLAVLLVFAGQGVVRQLLGMEVVTLIFSESSAVLLLVCLLVMVIASLLPGLFMARIPVADVFRRFSANKKFWKRSLLAFQFAVFAFLLCLLLNVGRQYRMMIHYDPGYEYENLVYYDMTGIEASMRGKLLAELERMPQVAHASWGNSHLSDGMAGNNVWLEGEERQLFNVADLYFVGDGYIETLGMEIVEGGNFTEQVGNSDQIMVSESFVEKMRSFADWSDGAVGKKICITEHVSYTGHQCYTLCGVYRNILLGGIGYEDTRPSVLFYSNDPQWGIYLYVRFNQLTGSTLAKADSILSGLVPGKEARFTPYRQDIVELYEDSARFRDQVMAGGVVCLLIMLMGLLGYLNDEITRRRKEIAVRRVHGADAKRILRFFLSDVLRVALPSALVGCAAAYWLSFRWLQQFSVKVSLAGWVYPLVLLLAFMVGYVCVGLRTRRFLSENPVEGLRTE